VTLGDWLDPPTVKSSCAGPDKIEEPEFVFILKKRRFPEISPEVPLLIAWSVDVFPPYFG
jgi:hypothetical protein